MAISFIREPSENGDAKITSKELKPLAGKFNSKVRTGRASDSYCKALMKIYFQWEKDNAYKLYRG